MGNSEQDTAEKANTDASEQNDEPKLTEKPEITEEHKEKAKEMHKAYDQERATVVMPGTDGAVAGTAVNDWLDDDGNPKYSEDSKPEDDADKGDEKSAADQP